MNKNRQVKSGLRFGIAMAIFFIVQDLITYDSLTAKNIVKIVVSSLVGGLIGGLLFVWLTGLLAKSKMLTKGTEIEIADDEKIEIESVGNHYKGAECVGGKLYLTNKRLVFKSNKYNMQNHELLINRSDIKKVERYKTLGVINKGLSVTTTHGTVEKFVVDHPGDWVKLLQTRLTRVDDGLTYGV